MSDTAVLKCQRCGAEMPGGICPRCVAAFLQATQTEISGEAGGKSSFTVPSVEELAPEFPQLEIIEMLGRGGMGAVYKARQKNIDRIIALKILPPGIGQDTAFAQRFNREARALAKLNHPGIITLYEFGHTPGGLYYFLMEFVDGVNLRELLESKPVPAREALAIVPQICDALQFAHDQGIVHRDIKPENILIDRRGRVKVADFGLAKLMGTGEGPAAGIAPAAGSSSFTNAGTVMGTPRYMAPEQVERPAEVDHRADIYALGVVFYQLLTGELPGKQLEPPSKKVHIDVRLDEVVLRALEQLPERRYQQASALKTQVETISAGEAQATAQNAPAKLTRWQSFGLIALDILVAGLVLFVGWAAYMTGTFFNVLYVSILLLVPARAMLIAWRAYHKSLELRLFKSPFARELRWHRFQLLNGWIFWLLATVTLKICIVPAQFAADEYLVLQILLWCGLFFMFALQLLPDKRIHWATNLAFLIGSVFIATQMVRIYAPVSKKDGVVLASPVRGEWLVLHGGRSSLINGHYLFGDQRDALDLERLVDGRERSGDPNKLTTYPSWNQTLYSPADGTIAVAEDDVDDNSIGQMSEDSVVGNHISLDLGNGKFVMMAHLKRGSLLVKPGDVVHVGQPLAKCGNSGNTSHPHLHIQAQNSARIFVTGTDAKTFPIFFRDVTCMHFKTQRLDEPFYLRRNDRIIAEVSSNDVPVFPKSTNTNSQ